MSNLSGSNAEKMRDIRRPNPGSAAAIEYKWARFLITERPSDATLDRYIEELQAHNVSDVVRVCEPSYAIDKLKLAGINVVDMFYPDGSAPPDDIVKQWFQLLMDRFSNDPKSCVAVHCVAGLGRAPVLVALALIELGMKYEDAVEKIRSQRRGAINATQLKYLSQYRPRRRLRKTLAPANEQPRCCVQ